MGVEVFRRKEPSRSQWPNVCTNFCFTYRFLFLFSELHLYWESNSRRVVAIELYVLKLRSTWSPSVVRFRSEVHWFFLFGICLFLFSGLMECGKRAIKTIRYWKNSAFFKNNWDLIAFADLKNKINAKFVLLLCVEREILLPKVLEKPCCVDPINYTFPRTH